jgi:hypothetical protein
MKKLLILAVIVAGAAFFWNKSQQGGNGTLDELQHRLDAAEQSFQQAGRAAGVSGVDTTSDAGSALRDVEQVERELRDLSRTTPSADEKGQIEKLLARAVDLKRRMG